MSDMEHLAILILAAGFSRRMGTWKPLLPLGENCIIARALGSCQKAGVKNIYVVVGFQGARLAAEIAELPAQILENPNFAEGMFTSVLRGARALVDRQGLLGFYVLPADIPLVQPATYKALAQAFTKENTIIYPAYQGQKGHPPLISTAYLPALLRWKQGGGLRKFLHQYADKASVLEVDDPYILFDIDTPDDYARGLQLVQEAKDNLPK